MNTIYIMYNTKHECVYNKTDLFIESDNVTEEEQLDIRDVIYKNDLLHIFDLDDFDEEIFYSMVNDLYNTMQKHTEFRDICVKMSNRYLILDGQFGFTLLYSYDYLEITHICVSEYLETGNISKDNIEKLKNKIEVKIEY